jgi:hypothetical protein
MDLEELKNARLYMPHEMTDIVIFASNKEEFKVDFHPLVLESEWAKSFTIQNLKNTIEYLENEKIKVPTLLNAKVLSFSPQSKESQA